MVRVAVNPIMGSSSQVIVDFNRGDDEFESAMSRLAAVLSRNQSDCSYTVFNNPFAVLDTLEGIGYKVVAANSAEKHSIVWQIWTLYKQA